MPQSNILSALIGFFFTVTILLVLFQNCSFYVGCGNRVEYMGEIPMREIGNNVENGGVSYSYPVPKDNDQGYAGV